MLRSISDYLVSRTIPSIVIMLVIVGCLFIVMADSQHVLSLVDHGRQVGFGWAPNWWASFIIVLPFQAGIGAYLLQLIRESFSEFHRRGALVIRSSPEPDDRRPPDDVRSDALIIGQVLWADFQAGRHKVLNIMACFIMFATMMQWYTSCGYVYVSQIASDGNIPGHVLDSIERDWTVAPLIVSSRATWLGSMVFSIFAYTYIGIMWVWEFYILMTVFQYAEFLRTRGKIRDQRQKVLLVPVHNHSFFGYVELSRILSCLSMICGASFVTYYFMRIQNTYLNSADSTVIFDVISSGFRAGTSGILNGNYSKIKDLLFGPQFIGSNSIIAFILAGITTLLFAGSFLAFSGFFNSLRDEIDGSQNGSLFGAGSRTPATVGKIKAELGKLPFTMRPNFSPRTLIFWVAFAWASIIWINIGVYFIVTYIASVVLYLARRFGSILGKVPGGMPHEEGRNVRKKR
jgi:hypothetical protein